MQYGISLKNNKNNKKQRKTRQSDIIDYKSILNKLKTGL